MSGREPWFAALRAAEAQVSLPPCICGLRRFYGGHCKCWLRVALSRAADSQKEPS